MSSNVSFDLLTINEEKSDFASSDPLRRREYRKSAQSSSMSLPLTQDEIPIDQTQKLAGLGLEIASSVIGNLIAHPCIVLRRQCQVNKKAFRCHLSPFTLIPVIARLQQRQGLKTLWKGAGGIFILRGFAVGVETVIAELTPFPREISVDTTVKHALQHLLLKSIAFGILTPFYCSSLVETVQSDIASEKPGVFDCLREGFCRLLKWGTPQSTRLLPIWCLIGPTVAYGLLNYIISSFAQCIFLWVLSIRLQKRHQKLGAIEKNHMRSSTKYFDDLASIHFGRMFSEALLFPVETVLNRLYLQGTRTIIDNLDTGSSVLPVISKYEGVLDCFHTIIHEEGRSGLYKGFGALIMEYALQAVIIKLAKTAFQEISSMFSSSGSHRTRPNV